MSRSRPPRRRRLLAGLAPVALVLGALPLLAPTCGDSGEGYKTFSRSSIIIPMDVCYQYQTDGMRTSYAPAGGSAACPNPDPGDVIRAYGLVYQLIHNDVAVYWIIDGQKTAVDGADLTIQYAGGFPVVFYDWTPENAPPSAPPTTAHAIDYRGGPFVVDGSDYARASQVLQQYRATFQNVNVHVSNVAFRAYAKRTMAGGWSAGGAVAPKVALLDIGSTSNPTSASSGYAKNSEPIIRGYLARAGLDFPGAGGVATDTGHGQIYDRLGIADLQPRTAGDWTTTNLYRYGYQILWVPHWFAPGSCADASDQARCFGSLYPAAQRDQAVKTVGAFVAAGKDLFAECAGLGSYEGVAAGASAWSTSYEDGDASTHFHTTNGLAINRPASGTNGQIGTADYDDGTGGSAASPLLQLGDYPFLPRTGAIQSYKPATGRTPASTYQSVPPNADAVRRLVTEVADPTWDYFTYRAPTPGVRGTSVYLAGHVYSGYADTLSSTGGLVSDNATFQIGGTRLVLNTLFNLGATCTSSGVACNTGLLGICAQGTIQCQNGQPVCTPVSQPLDHEVCNGLDDNCNGEIDEGLQLDCYDGDPATKNVGVCRAGVSSCVQTAGGWGMSACVGQVLPTAEVCNALDDDCDGQTDEALTQACYEGPQSSIDPATGRPRPVCQAGTQTCNVGSWGACVGQVLPRPEVCDESGAAGDDDCDGVVNNGCTCQTGQTRACYSGPPATAGVGICRAGSQLCTSGTWGPCTGEVLPQAEACGNATDENCDTLAPPCPECQPGETRTCYPGGATDVIGGASQCSSGHQACDVDHWGPCLGATLPASLEACDAVDNDCDGVVDDGAVCPERFVCEHGVCVPDSCGVEVPPPEGYVCDPPPSQGGTGDANGVVERGPCGDLAAGCPDGQACRYGSCIAACAGDPCAAGSTCGGGACVSGGCYAAGCPDGQLCRDGACVADPCGGVLCPSGTFCRAGDCVQSCAFVSCLQGEICGVDGFCEPDPCAGKTCAPGERCTNGVCGANPCSGKGCAPGQTCVVDGGTAVCVDDPCSGVRCPAGACSGGQCFSTANPTGAGTIPKGGADEAAGGCGCGSGGGVALPALLLALFALPRARRRTPRTGPGGGLALLLVAVVVLGAACKKEEDAFDPAACVETCGEQRCVNVATDPSHCGGCGAEFACPSGQICVDAVCGPSTAVAPFIRSISPTSGPRGSLVPVPVQIAGERFAAGAQIRAVSGATTRTFPATLVDATHLSVDLDLSQASPTTWQLRVVNANNVISNAAPFDVVIPYPNVESVTPDTVTAGTTTEVVLAGTNFTSTSQCRLQSTTTNVAETGLPSVVDAAGVHCTVNAAALPPGTYDLWVVNEGNLASNVRQLQITSATSTLTAVSPSSGAANATVSLTVTGTGFDVSSRVLFDGCAGPAQPSSCGPAVPIVGTTFVSSTTLIAALPLPECAATTCGHTVSVRSGSGATTSTLPFTVAAGQPVIATFSPPTAYQGDDPVALAFTGTSFVAPGATIQVQAPGGAFSAAPVTTTSSTSTTVSGTMSLVGQPEGSWLARIDFGNGIFSAAWPFRVLSNQAVLRDLAAAPAPERSGAAGTTKSSVTFQVANVRPPYSAVRVMFRGPNGYAHEYDPSPDPTSDTSPLTVSTLSLADLDTGTYTFTVKNPNGATESNALSFNVTPGAPTLATVSPASYPQSSSNPVVAVTLGGTNFAKPDATGSGGSVVHVTMIDQSKPVGDPNRILVPDTAVPAADTNVVSRTEIRLNLDVRAGLVGSYDLQVWNPSLPTSVPAVPQKSNVLTDAFTIAP